MRVLGYLLGLSLLAAVSAQADPLGLVDYEALLASEGEVISERVTEFGQHRVELRDGVVLFIRDDGTIGGGSGFSLACFVERLAIVAAYGNTLDVDPPELEVRRLNILISSALFAYAGRVRPNIVTLDEVASAFEERVRSDMEWIGNDLIDFGRDEEAVEEFTELWSQLVSDETFEFTVAELEAVIIVEALPTGTCGATIYVS